MCRRLVVAVAWLLAIASVVVAVGMRVRSHRLADPIQALRRTFTWVPDDMRPLLTMLGRSPDGGVQIELRGQPVDVGRFAERNRMEAVTTPLYGGVPMRRWTFADPRRPGVMVHLVLPGDGSPALITIGGVDP